MKRVNTDEQCVTENGIIFRPIVTLANDEGGRCQISIDDDCYLIRLKQEDGTYKAPTPFIFKEVLEELKKLPEPQILKYLTKSGEFIRKNDSYGEYFEHKTYNSLCVWVKNSKTKVGRKVNDTLIEVAEVDDLNEFLKTLKLLMG